MHKLVCLTRVARVGTVDVDEKRLESFLRHTWHAVGDLALPFFNSSCKRCSVLAMYEINSKSVQSR